jgi:hypothetical protein
VAASPKREQAERKQQRNQDEVPAGDEEENGREGETDQ